MIFPAEIFPTIVDWDNDDFAEFEAVTIMLELAKERLCVKLLSGHFITL